MPFFPALPEYHPAITRPVEEFAGGLTAGTNVMMRGAQAAAMREAAQQPGRIREAMAEGQQTGDYSKLAQVSPETAFRLNEEQRKQVEAGLKDWETISPFINKENYGEMRSWLLKRNPALPAGMLPGGPDVDVEAVKSTVSDRAAKVKEQMERAGLKPKVEAQQELFRTTEMPALREKFKLSTEQALATQAQWGRIQAGLLSQRQEFERGSEKFTHRVDLEKNILTNQQRETNALETERTRLKTLLKDQGLAPEQFTEASKEVDYQINAAINASNNFYSTWGKRHGVDLPTRQLPEGPAGQTGPPPRGTDPNFDRAMDRVNALPAGPGREAERKKLMDRYYAQGGGAAARSVPLTPAPGAAPAAPAPVAPTAPPREEKKETPKPAVPKAAPAPAAKPTAPAAPAPAPVYTGTIEAPKVTVSPEVTAMVDAVKDEFRSFLSSFKPRTKKEREERLGEPEEEWWTK